MIDERSKRRPDFDEGPATVPILMADGQEWHLPRPATRFVPDDGEAGFKARWNLGDEYGRLVEASDAAVEGGDVIRAEMALFRFLLGLKYDLTTEELGELIVIGYRDFHEPSDVELRARLLDLANGRVEAPKRSTAGSD